MSQLLKKSKFIEKFLSTNKSLFGESLNTVNKNLKKIAIVLIGIILLPALFYTGYEVNALSETEEMIEEIYKQQLDVLLFSVNQHAWDYIDTWANKIENKLLADGDKSINMGELMETNLFSGIIVYQELLGKPYIVNLKKDISDTITTEAEFYLQENTGLLNNLNKMKEKGYRKIEPVFFSSANKNGNNLLGLVFSILNNDSPIYVVLVVNADNFIENIIEKKLNEIAGSSLSVGIFDESSGLVKASNTNLSLKDAVVRKKLWVFPKHSLGIGLKGSSISELAEQRLFRSILLIVILDLIIFAGGWFIFRNIKKEIHLAQLKSDFVSNVSHELRTPLSLIRMYAETLEMDRVNDDARKIEYYKNISLESERLTHLINNILNFSRMESGRKEYYFEPIELNNLVKEIFNIYKDHVNVNGFKYDVDYFDGELPLMADKTSLSEALINLIDNAIKYSMDEKHIAIKTGREKESIFIEVEDHGMGIDPANHKKVFENFFRETTGHVHNTKGSGLGLALVKHIMTAHNGDIHLKSSPGEGSTFRLLFPGTES